MDLHKIYLFCLLINIFTALGVNSKFVCPSQCLCSLKNGYKSVRCNNRNIMDVNLEIPNIIQIYDLSNNSIYKLEDYCFQDMELTSLIEINVSDNRIIWIGLHALAGLNNLEVLNLSGNRLQFLQPDLFWYNPKLKSLDISRNKLWNIKNVPFLQHTNMEVLNLSNSQISHIPDEMFTYLPSLVTLDLSKNYMINLKISVLKPLKNLMTLNLDGNQWRCNEDFNNLQSWIMSQSFDYAPQCETKKPKMFEKMISLVPIKQENESSIENLDELWKNHGELDNLSSSTEIPLAEDEVVKVYPLITFAIGILVGILIGTIFTYCWLAQCCRNTCCRSDRRRRNRLNEAREQLIPANRIFVNNESTPVMRRQFSLQDSFFRGSSCQLSDRTEEVRQHPASSAPSVVYRDIFGADRSESPPPTYRQCLNDNVIST